MKKRKKKKKPTYTLLLSSHVSHLFSALQKRLLHIVPVNDSLNYQKKKIQNDEFSPFQELNPKYLNGDVNINKHNPSRCSKKKKDYKPISRIIASFPWKT